MLFPLPCLRNNTILFKGIISDCDSKVSRIKEVKKSFGLELRLIKDKSLRVDYEAKAKEYDTKYNEIFISYQDAKNKFMKQDLVKGAGGNSSGRSNPTEGKSNDELLLGAAKIQEKTFESLARTQGNGVYHPYYNIIILS